MNHLTHCALMALVSAVLFFILSPGVLLTLPKAHGTGCGVFMQLAKPKKTAGANGVPSQVDREQGGCATSYAACAVHALLFGLLMFGLCFFMCKDGVKALPKM